MTSLLPTVNLPLPIRLHALALCALGLKLTFASSSSTKPAPTGTQDRTLVGIASTAIGLCYLSTAYMPTEKNAILYASAPVRIVIAALTGARLLVDYWRGTGGSGNGIRTRALLALMLYDGLGGLWLGWWLGTYSGRIPEYQT